MLFTLDDCGGCKTCELACSFRLTGDFNFHVSAIEITENKDRTGYFVSLVDEEETGRLLCDGCLEFETPACVTYCHKGEELQKLIDQFMEAQQVKEQNHKGDFENHE